MADPAESSFLDLWQSETAGHRISGTTDVIGDRLRDVLITDADGIPKKAVSPNSVDDGLTAKTQDWSVTGPVQLSALLPEVLPASPPTRDVRDRFKLLHKREGTVIARSDQEFTAVLREKDEPDWEATFDIDEVPEGDRGLIIPGAVFHWSIGYRDRRGGRIRESIIRFRRLPAWTKREIERAEREADEIVAALNWGESQAAR